MRWRDAIALAGRGLRRRPGRVALTVLAVGLASTLLTALLTIAGTAETRVLSELSKGGPLAGIKVVPAEADPEQVDNDNPRPGPPRDIDEAALQRISGVPGVASVVPVTTARMLVVPADGQVDAFGEQVVGVDLARAGRLPITVIAGRLPVPGSATEVAVTGGYLERVRLKRADADKILGSEVELGAPRAFPGTSDPRFRARWVRATIVGVVAQEAANGQLLASSEQVRAAREWAAAGPAFGRAAQPSSPYSGLFVVARHLDEVGKVRGRITASGYSTSAPENLIASVQRYLHVVEIVLTGIGAIALVVAALGIANAMLAAVRERRREIGVLKAVGARDRDVRRAYLVEAAVVGWTGGIIGAVAGWITALAVATVVNRYLTREGLASVRLGVPVGVLALSVAGSTVLALLAGTFPAVRAARLPARDAIGGG
jgi:putative ABC transport system permease protein